MPSLWMKKSMRLFWVVLVAISCFTLGYTVKPKPDRRAMLKKMNINAPVGALRTLPPNVRMRRK